MKNADSILPEIERIIHDKFTGSLTLHCQDGQVLKYQTEQVLRPGREIVNLEEQHAGNGAPPPPPAPDGPVGRFLKESDIPPRPLRPGPR